MAKQCVIKVDLASVYEKSTGKGSRLIAMLAWGDVVEVVETKPTYLKVKVIEFVPQADGTALPVKTDAYIVPPKSAVKPDGTKLKPADVVIPAKQNAVLKVNFVDVQQGDGSVIESPDGKIILVDGGDNQMFARYLAARFRGTTKAKPKKIDCILVTHGDADHFAGLHEIYESEQNLVAKSSSSSHPSGSTTTAW